ncbi:MAG TPA: ABC transporter substrate-binding protein [Pirellulales bacterium]|nr:ABC transporter substrate-binding protein [Pirellulales bacterium]
MRPARPNRARARLIVVSVSIAAVIWGAWHWGAGASNISSTNPEADVPAGLTPAGVPPAASDVLRVSYSDDPETLNPITAGDATSALFQSFVYEQLADRDIAKPDELLPRLAEKWEFDEKTLEYTIHLRRGVKWHPMTLPDGTALPQPEVTTRDVMFTFDCILNPNIPASARGDFVDAEAEDEEHRYKIRIEAIDDYTFKVRWTKPYFLSDESTLMVAVIPRHVFSVDRHGDLISLDFSSKEFAEGFNDHWANTRMCGTGPMVFVDWNRNERMALARNPEYWGKPFFFSRIVFGAEPNSYTLLQKLLQDEIDWADIDEKDLYLQSLHHPAVESGRVVLKTYEYPGYRYIGYNLRRPFLRDKHVRRALTQAIPIDQIISVVFDGLATQVTGPFIVQSPAYNHEVKPLPFDLARAQRLLDQSEWRDTNRNGLRDKLVDGQRIEARINLMIDADSAQYLTVAQIIQVNWRKLGIQVDITPAQQALMSERTRAKEFDAVLRGWALSWRADPYQTWYSGNAELADTSNIIGYSNPEVDRLVTELRVTFDRKKQIELYHAIHRLIYEDQPYTFLFSEKQTCGYSGRLRNVKFYPDRPCVDYRQWYSE